MSKQKPSRPAGERNTPEHARRREAIAVVKGCRAAIEAYLANVQREADRTLAILDRVQLWAEHGGPVPTFVQQFRDAHRLTFALRPDEPVSPDAQAAAHAVIDHYDSSVTVFGTALHECLAHAAGATTNTAEGSARAVGTSLEDAATAPLVRDVTAALETALNAA